jgi:hypothetical protein
VLQKEKKTINKKGVEVVCSLAKWPTTMMKNKWKNRYLFVVMTSKKKKKTIQTAPPNALAK